MVTQQSFPSQRPLPPWCEMNLRCAKSLHQAASRAIASSVDRLFGFICSVVVFPLSRSSAMLCRSGFCYALESCLSPLQQDSLGWETYSQGAAWVKSRLSQLEQRLTIFLLTAQFLSQVSVPTDVISNEHPLGGERSRWSGFSWPVRCLDLRFQDKVWMRDSEAERDLTGSTILLERPSKLHSGKIATFFPGHIFQLACTTSLQCVCRKGMHPLCYLSFDNGTCGAWRG